MMAATGYANRKVAVLGLARSGLAAARALAEGGAEVLGWDDSENGRDRAEAAGIPLVDLRRADWSEVAALIVSPGIAHLYPAPNPIIAAAMAAGVPVDNDIGLFFASFGRADWAQLQTVPRVVAVTGSNGKSTVTALIHHILQSCNIPAQMGGNIGLGVFDLEPAHDGEVIVLELSSYQTELARALTPDIAVFTNLTPDHLDRHGGHGGYFAAKRRLFAEGAPDRAIIGVDEPEGRMLANQIALAPEDDRLIRVSSTSKLGGPGWYVLARKGFLAEWRKNKQMASIDLRGFVGLAGAHNQQNAAAAYAACRALGLGPRQIEPALASFTALPHRCQFLGEVNGVRVINDSKATNADSTAYALAAFKNIRWIAGGQAKAGGIASLAPHFGNVAKAYLIGDAQIDFATTLGEHPNECCETLANAVAKALAEAAPGDVLLLSPACASFDQFTSFEDRGAQFAALCGFDLLS
ncbi:MAG: UDP-N-acetylmuramoyl-L-alanine--D-glutamate ligase [Paracoccaceae bacterium]